MLRLPFLVKWLWLHFSTVSMLLCATSSSLECFFFQFVGRQSQDFVQAMPVHSAAVVVSGIVGIGMRRSLLLGDGAGVSQRRRGKTTAWHLGGGGRRNESLGGCCCRLPLVLLFFFLFLPMRRRRRKPISIINLVIIMLAPLLSSTLMSSFRSVLLWRGGGDKTL